MPEEKDWPCTGSPRPAPSRAATADAKASTVGLSIRA